MEILGHRGWPAPEHPENTVPAALAALAAGADGVEVDVRLTADGVPVCVHDADLGRVAGVSVDVAATAYADLAQVLLQGTGGAVGVPRLADLAAAVAGGGRLVLDLKPSGTPLGLVAAAVTAVRVAGVHPAEVVVSSFDRRVVAAAAVVAPWLERALIVPPRGDGRAAVADAARRSDRAVHLPLDVLLAEPDVVRDARRAGLTVRAWTVNRVVDARLLGLLDVSAVITDEPALLTGALRPVAAG